MVHERIRATPPFVKSGGTSKTGRVLVFVAGVFTIDFNALKAAALSHMVLVS